MRTWTLPFGLGTVGAAANCDLAAANYKDTDRSAENIFFVRGVTRRGAENSKDVSDFLCVTARACGDQPRCASVNRCSD